jgi:hypothetical protein
MSESQLMIIEQLQAENEKLKAHQATLDSRLYSLLPYVPDDILCGELQAKVNEFEALAKWSCSSCGCRFPQLPPQPEITLEGVTRCSKCVEVEVLANLLAQAQQEKEKMEAEKDALIEKKQAAILLRETEYRYCLTTLEAVNAENDELAERVSSLRQELAAKECSCVLIIPPDAKPLLGMEQFVCETHIGHGVFNIATKRSVECCGYCWTAAKEPEGNDG